LIRPLLPFLPEAFFPLFFTPTIFAPDGFLALVELDSCGPPATRAFVSLVPPCYEFLNGLHSGTCAVPVFPVFWRCLAFYRLGYRAEFAYIELQMSSRLSRLSFSRLFHICLLLRFFLFYGLKPVCPRETCAFRVVRCRPLSPLSLASPDGSKAPFGASCPSPLRLALLPMR